MGDPAVFISAKSEDYPAAQRVYEFLMAQGIACFFSNETLLEMGEADYKDAIDQALEGAAHLVLVTSSRAHAESKWVKYEWNTFANELLSGRKTGNILTILCGGLAPGALPIALRQRQCLNIESELEKLPRFLRGPRIKPDSVISDPLAFKPEGASETEARILAAPRTVPLPVKEHRTPESRGPEAMPSSADPRLIPWLFGWAAVGCLIGLLHAAMIQGFGSDNAIMGAGGFGGWMIYVIGGWLLVRGRLASKAPWFGWVAPAYLLVSGCQVVPQMLAMERSSDYLLGMFCYTAVGGLLSGVAHALAFRQRGLRGWWMIAWGAVSQWLAGSIVLGAFHLGVSVPDWVFYSFFPVAQVAGLTIFSWGLRREMRRAAMV